MEDFVTDSEPVVGASDEDIQEMIARGIPGFVESAPLDPDYEVVEGSEGFDWGSEVILIESPREKHRAYDMTYRQFLENKIANDTDAEINSKIGIHVDPELLDMLQLFKENYSEPSLYPVLATLIEIGFIHERYDYADESESLNSTLREMRESNDADNRNLTLRWLDDCRIKLPSKNGKKLVTPAIPAWLGNAVRQISMEYHMTISDYCTLLICMAVRTDLNEHPLPKTYIAFMDEIEMVFSNHLLRLNKTIHYHKEDY